MLAAVEKQNRQTYLIREDESKDSSNALYDNDDSKNNGILKRDDSYFEFM